MSGSPSQDLSESFSAPKEVDVAIVGGGPAGIILANLLVRCGLSVLVLEACQDFDREFRGDALTPSVLRVLDQMGLMEQVLQLPHSKLSKVDIETSQGPVTVTDYSVLPVPYNYVLVAPQPKLLELVVSNSKGYEGFHLMMGARLTGLIRASGMSQGKVVGLEYQKANQTFQVAAQLVVGADGRHSKTRELIGETPIRNAPPMDVLWFRLPRCDSDTPSRNLSVSYGRGYYVALTDKHDHWTVAYVMKKGAYRELRQRGIEHFRDSISALIPEFRQRLDQLDWPSIFYLAPDSSRCRQWYRDGLLLIGDAAHVMSSVGGLGIQTAIGDAVVVANQLASVLRQRKLSRWHLLAVQLRRWPLVAALQLVQRTGQKSVIARILDPERPFTVPFYLRSRPMQWLTGWVVGYGLKLELPDRSLWRGTWRSHQLGQR